MLYTPLLHFSVGGLLGLSTLAYSVYIYNRDGVLPWAKKKYDDSVDRWAPVGTVVVLATVAGPLGWPLLVVALLARRLGIKAKKRKKERAEEQSELDAALEEIGL